MHGGMQIITLHIILSLELLHWKFNAIGKTISAVAAMVYIILWICHISQWQLNDYNRHSGGVASIVSYEHNFIIVLHAYS